MSSFRRPPTRTYCALDFSFLLCGQACIYISPLILHSTPCSTDFTITQFALCMDATRSLEDAQRTMRLNEKVRARAQFIYRILSLLPFTPTSDGLQTTALLLTGRRPDAPPYLGPGASESSSEATYLSLLCDLEEAKKKGRKGCGTDMTTTHTVPPSHIAGLLRQEIARQKNLVRFIILKSLSTSTFLFPDFSSLPSLLPLFLLPFLDRSGRCPFPVFSGVPVLHPTNL